MRMLAILLSLPSLNFAVNSLNPIFMFPNIPPASITGLKLFLSQQSTLLYHRNLTNAKFYHDYTSDPANTNYPVKIFTLTASYIALIDGVLADIILIQEHALAQIYIEDYAQRFDYLCVKMHEHILLASTNLDINTIDRSSLSKLHVNLEALEVVLKEWNRLTRKVFGKHAIWLPVNYHPEIMREFKEYVRKLVDMLLKEQRLLPVTHFNVHSLVLKNAHAVYTFTVLKFERIYRMAGECELMNSWGIEKILKGIMDEYVEYSILFSGIVVKILRAGVDFNMSQAVLKGIEKWDVVEVRFWNMFR